MEEDRTSIVIVEDEEDLADTFFHWLKDDYDVSTAYNGEKALEIINEETDIVLLDRKMPDISGDEVLEHIENKEYSCKVSMVTATEPDFDIVDMGFDSYVVKPIDKKGLIEVVKKLETLDDYEAKVREAANLAMKKEMLEERKSDKELEENEEYQSLLSKLKDLNNSLDKTLSDLKSHNDYASLFRGIND